MKDYTIIRLICSVLFLITLGLFASCSDWTDMKVVKNEIKKPWERDPALWAQYTSALRDYKKSKHFISYARLHNSPEVAVGEQDFMRCLPDSLDIVSLTNADNFSKFDTEDLSVMKEKGTKVLYRVDYANRAEEFPDDAKLTAYLDRVVEMVSKNGLDGYSFTGNLRMNDAKTAAAAALIVAKLSADDSKLLAFEGNPLFVALPDRAKVDYFVLDTEKTNNVTELKLQVLNALSYGAVPANKLLLAAKAEATFKDENLEEQVAITAFTNFVVTLGPLAGLAVYDIDKDYYHSERNYNTIRQSIQTLNPSK